jgi:hypothetical protein
MEEKTYKITLSDGTTIEDLKLNGNNFISEKPIETSLFESNCSPVTISSDEIEDIHTHMELVQITEMNGEYWFVLRDLSKEELDKMKIQSDIEYVAMMAGIEL